MARRLRPSHVPSMDALAVASRLLAHDPTSTTQALLSRLSADHRRLVARAVLAELSEGGSLLEFLLRRAEESDEESQEILGGWVARVLGTS